MPHTFVLSDENAINDLGGRILTGGIDLSAFQKNPVMLYWHDQFNLPIGRWENIRKEKGQLLGDAVFDQEDEFAKQVEGKVERGFLKGASVGLEMIELSEDPELMLKGQTRATVSKSLIYEASLVPLPSNPNTLKLKSKGGIVLRAEGTDAATLNKLLPLITKTEQMDKKKIALGLGLSEDATEKEIMEALEKKAGKKEDPPTGEERLVKGLIQLGREKGLITDENEETYRKLAGQDFEATMDLIESHKPEKKEDATIRLSKVIEEIGKGKGDGGKTDDDPRAGWTIRDWEEKDPDGLLNLRKKDNERYMKMYNSYYKKGQS